MCNQKLFRIFASQKQTIIYGYFRKHQRRVRYRSRENPDRKRGSTGKCSRRSIKNRTEAFAGKHLLAHKHGEEEMQTRIKWIINEIDEFLKSSHTEKELVDMIERIKDRLESIVQINQGW